MSRKDRGFRSTIEEFLIQTLRSVDHEFSRSRTSKQEWARRFAHDCIEYAFVLAIFGYFISAEFVGLYKVGL